MARTDVTLKDVISTDVISVSPGANLREALKLMLDNRVSALPVVDERKQCIGVISITDFLGVTRDLSEELSALSNYSELDHNALLERFEHANLLMEDVRTWVSLEPVSVGIESSIQHAAQVMLRNRVHRLIVVDDERQMIGIVSAMDLLAAFAEETAAD
jgi:CBS-domain-containing membrane protein